MRRRGYVRRDNSQGMLTVFSTSFPSVMIQSSLQMSYLGNWCVKMEPSIIPCDKDWLGRGPMQDITTQKHDYSWKCGDRAEPLKAQDNLYPPCAGFCGNCRYQRSIQLLPLSVPLHIHCDSLIINISVEESKLHLVTCAL